MIDGLGPYPEYRDSGVSWLGRVPAHWQLKRGKALFGESQLPVRESDEIVTCFRDGQVTLRRNRRTTGFMIALKEAGYQGVRKGQLVIHAMDAFAGAIGISDSDGKCTPEYIVCEPRHSDIQPAYFAQVLRLAAWQRYIEVSCNAVRERAPRLRYPNFGDMVLPVPAPAEQTAIVRFLAHADHRIRRYIHAKQRLITLLEEQKQAIIHQTVTRGLDPNVRLKPSGIEWLGELPSHWRVVRLKSMVSMVTSGSRGWSSYATDSGVLFLRIGNLTRSSLDLDLADTVRLSLPSSGLREAERTRVMANDILMSITAYIGSVAVVPEGLEEAFVSQHVACCRLLQPCTTTARWVGYVLLSSIGQNHGRLRMYGGTKQGLSLDDVGSYLVIVPPESEQQELVAWIEAKSRDVDHALITAKREISLLREYRTRLIADVVTGQLDVRAAAAALPDEPDDPTPLDDADLTESEDDADPDSEANPDAEAIASDD